MKKIIKPSALFLILITPIFAAANKKEYAIMCISNCKDTVNSAIACLLKKTDKIISGRVDNKTAITGTVKYAYKMDNNKNWSDVITFFLTKKMAPDTVIGSIEIYYKPKPNIFYIADLSIDKDYQNQGLGNILLTLALELAKDKQFNQYRDVEVNLIPMPTDFDKKEILIKYYKSFGFGSVEPDSRQRLYIKKQQAKTVPEL